MHLKIITPEEILFDGKVTLVQVPGKAGKFAMLKNHAPIISTLTEGQVRIKDKHGEEDFYEIPGGVIQMKNNEIIVLTEMSE